MAIQRPRITQQPANSEGGGGGGGKWPAATSCRATWRSPVLPCYTWVNVAAAAAADFLYVWHPPWTFPRRHFPWLPPVKRNKIVNHISTLTPTLISLARNGSQRENDRGGKHLGGNVRIPIFFCQPMALCNTSIYVVSMCWQKWRRPPLSGPRRTFRRSQRPVTRLLTRRPRALQSAPETEAPAAMLWRRRFRRPLTSRCSWSRSCLTLDEWCSTSTPGVYIFTVLIANSSTGVSRHTTKKWWSASQTLNIGYNTVWSELCECIRANSLQTVLGRGRKNSFCFKKFLGN